MKRSKSDEKLNVQAPSKNDKFEDESLIINF